MFPGDPVEAESSPRSPSNRKFTLRTSAIYVVSYNDLPTNVAAVAEKNVELQKLFFDKARDGLRDGIQTKTKINLLEEADISISGYPGRSVKIVMENGGVARQHVYLVRTRLYMIVVTTPKEALATDGGGFDQMRAAKFLDSFKPAAAEDVGRGRPDDQ